MSLELNRRDLLRFFRIGATIVPVIGGAVKTETLARLIEVPKLEPVEPVRADALRGFDTILQVGDGLSPETFLNIRAVAVRGPIASQPSMDVTQRAIASPYRTLIPGPFDDCALSLTVLRDPHDDMPPSGLDYLYISRQMRNFRLGGINERRKFTGYVERIENWAPHRAEREVTIRITAAPTLA